MKKKIIAQINLEDLFQITEIAERIVKSGLSPTDVRSLRLASTTMRAPLTTRNPAHMDLRHRDTHELMKEIYSQAHRPRPTYTYGVDSNTHVSITSLLRIELPRTHLVTEGDNETPYTVNLDNFIRAINVAKHNTKKRDALVIDFLLLTRLNLSLTLDHPHSDTEKNDMKAQLAYIFKQLQTAADLIKKTKDAIHTHRETTPIPMHAEENFHIPPRIQLQCKNLHTVRFVQTVIDRYKPPFDVNIGIDLTVKETVRQEPGSDYPLVTDTYRLSSVRLNDVSGLFALGVMSFLDDRIHTLALHNSNLTNMTPVEIHAKVMKDTTIEILDITGSTINPIQLVALLKHIKLDGDLILKNVNLSELTDEHINAFPDTLNIRHLDLTGTQIDPKILASLLQKLKPGGDVRLRDVNLETLSQRDIATLPQLNIKSLDLENTALSPIILAELLRHLRASGHLILGRLDLSAMTEQDIATIPEDLSIRDLDLFHTNIGSEQLVMILNRLMPTGTLRLSNLRLEGLDDALVNKLNARIDLKGLKCESTLLTGPKPLLLLKKLFPSRRLELSNLGWLDFDEAELNDLFQGQSLEILILNTLILRDNALWTIVDNVRIGHTLSIKNINLDRQETPTEQAHTHPLHTLEICCQNNFGRNPAAIKHLLRHRPPTHTLRLRGLQLQRTPTKDLADIPVRHSLKMLDLRRYIGPTQMSIHMLVYLLNTFKPKHADISQLQIFDRVYGDRSPEPERFQELELGLSVEVKGAHKDCFYSNHDNDEGKQLACVDAMHRLSPRKTSIDARHERELAQRLQDAFSTPSGRIRLKNLDLRALTHHILRSLSVNDVKELELDNVTITPAYLAHLLNIAQPKTNLVIKNSHITDAFNTLNPLKPLHLTNVQLSNTQITRHALFDLLGRMTIQDTLILFKVTVLEDKRPDDAPVLTHWDSESRAPLRTLRLVSNECDVSTVEMIAQHFPASHTLHIGGNLDGLNSERFAYDRPGIQILDFSPGTNASNTVISGERIIQLIATLQPSEEVNLTNVTPRPDLEETSVRSTLRHYPHSPELTLGVVGRFSHFFRPNSGLNALSEIFSKEKKAKSD